MDYRVASNIRGKSLSSLITDRITSGGSVGSSIKGAISDKLKAKGTGIKEKFDPLNIARAMTGGGKLAPAILGRMTGRSQADINYFAGNKKKFSTYTKMPSIGQVPSEGFGGSAIEVLNKMLAFMQKNREDDLKRKEIHQSFEEERQSEEQRRHNQFLKVLKDFTGVKTSTAIPEKSGGMFDGLMDVLKGMFDKILDSEWLKNLKSFANSKFFLSLLANPVFLGLAGAAALLYLLANDKNPEATTAGILGSVNDAAVGTEIMKQQEENVSPEELNKKIEVRRALLKDAPLSVKYLGKGQKEYIENLGVPKTQVEQLFDNTKPLVVPEKLKSIDPQLYNNLSGEQKSATSITKKSGVALTQNSPIMGTDSTTVTQTPSAAPAPAVTPVPATTTPVPATPASSAVVGKIQENNDLNLQDSITVGTSSSPSVSVNNSSTSAPDQTVTATATTRDDTPILDLVMKRTKAQV
jgi:hypothetical protein